MYVARLPMAARSSRALLLAIALVAGVAAQGRAADDFENVHAEGGRQWYDKFCTPCHGPAGAPGSAVYPDTKKPVDLRDYVARNGGKFPAARWIAVVTTDNPSLVHTAVWQRIRDYQGGIGTSDATARAMVASIASYVRSVQK